MMVRVMVFLKRTVVGEKPFDNHGESQLECLVKSVCLSKVVQVRGN